MKKYSNYFTSAFKIKHIKTITLPEMLMIIIAHDHNFHNHNLYNDNLHKITIKPLMI